MVPIRWFLLLVLLVLAAPAPAADIVYPPGSRIGLAAPKGMVPSKSFLGFEDRDNRVAIIVAALPTDAYAHLERTADAESLKKQGLILEQREALPLAIGKAFLLTARQEADKTRYRKWLLVASTSELTALVTVQVPEAAAGLYPDAAIRSALASIAVRPTVPVEEQLGLLPFKIGDLAAFKVGAVFPGRAVVLSDATTDAPATATAPHVVIAVTPGGPVQAGDRDTFARTVFGTIPNLKEVRITASEPLRIGGHQGHQILATAKDAATGAEVTIVQWLRFGGGAYLHMVGVVATDGWIPAYARFRSVRDSIEPR